MPYVEVEGTRLSYVDLGPPDALPPVVLLHAFPLHAEMWAPQLAYLAARRRVIAPDLSGFGRSEAPSDPSAYSVRRWADEVAGLLDALGIERAVVAGLSMGGYVALALLRHHADRLAGLVLADTRPSPDTEEVRARRTAQQEQLARGERDELIEALTSGLLAPSTRSGQPDLVNQVRRLAEANPDHGILGGLAAMKARPDSSEALSAVAVPTLVLVGAQDAMSTPDEAQGWSEGVPGARLVVLPGAGHLSNLEAAEAFNAALDDFLDTL